MQLWSTHLLLHSVGLLLLGLTAVGIRVAWRSDPVASYRFLVVLLCAALGLPALQWVVQGKAPRFPMAAILAALEADPEAQGGEVARSGAPVGVDPPMGAKAAPRSSLAPADSRAPAPAGRVLPRVMPRIQQPAAARPDVVRRDRTAQEGEAPLRSRPPLGPARAEAPRRAAELLASPSAQEPGLPERIPVGAVASGLRLPRGEWIYAAGVALLAAFHALRLRRTWALLRAATVVEDVSIRRLWRQVAGASRWFERIRLLESTQLSAPACWGWLRPALVLPVGSATDLNPRTLRFALHHELVHLERRDSLVALLQALLTTLFWFHPFAWWISRELDRQRELSCDLLVVLSSGARRSYALALLEYAQLPRSPRPEESGASLVSGSSSPACPTLLHWTRSPSQLRRRIEMLANNKLPVTRARRWIRRMAVGGLFASLCSVQLGLAAALPAAGEEKAPPPPPAPAVVAWPAPAPAVPAPPRPPSEEAAVQLPAPAVAALPLPRPQPAPRLALAAVPAPVAVPAPMPVPAPVLAPTRPGRPGPVVLPAPALAAAPLAQEDERTLRRMMQEMEARLHELEAQLEQKEVQLERASRDLERLLRDPQDRAPRETRPDRTRRDDDLTEDLSAGLRRLEASLASSEARLREREARMQELERALEGSRGEIHGRSDAARRDEDRAAEARQRAAEAEERAQARAAEARDRAAERAAEGRERALQRSEEGRRRADALRAEMEERSEGARQKVQEALERARQIMEERSHDPAVQELLEEAHRQHEAQRAGKAPRDARPEADKVRKEVERAMRESRREVERALRDLGEQDSLGDLDLDIATEIEASVNDAVEEALRELERTLEGLDVSLENVHDELREVIEEALETRGDARKNRDVRVDGGWWPDTDPAATRFEGGWWQGTDPAAQGGFPFAASPFPWRPGMTWNQGPGAASNPFVGSRDSQEWWSNRFPAAGQQDGPNGWQQQWHQQGQPQWRQPRQQGKDRSER